MTDYTCVAIQCDPSSTEMIFALLSSLPFDSFEEEEEGGKGYIPTAQWTEEVRETVADYQEIIPFTWEATAVKNENWNAIWESGFQPIRIGTFCGIRASFHEPLTGLAHELIIDPKMAFGTGHHETTEMMVAAMESIDFFNKRVFDFGCGTGVLAILAKKLGATDVWAIDYDPASTENTLENVILNHAEPVTVLEGSLEVMPSEPFEVILANINRNVLMETLPQLSQLLLPDGILLISGILIRDKQMLLDKAQESGLHYESERTKGDWCMLRFRR